MRDKYAKSKRIDAAIGVIQRGEFTVYSDVADYYEYSRLVVSRHMRGLTKSRKEALSFWHQCLTDKQEKILIWHINDLIDREISPTN
jgi:hypothetical protein